MPSRLTRVLSLPLLLAACNGAAPPPNPAAPPAAANAHGNCLASLPVTPLTTPAASLYAQDFAATPLDAAGLRCIAEVWGETRFASPERHDPAYAPIQAAHGEDGDLRWTNVAHERVQLLRIAQGAAAATWLLRIDTGLAMEGSRYDLIFTSDAHGRLSDQMLVGVEGVMYRRNVDLRSPLQFTVLEVGGRETASGPDYRAAFRIDDDGRIASDPQGSTEALDPAAVNAAADPDQPADGDSATSVEEVDGAPGDAEAIRQLLFSDSGVIEEVVQRQTLADGSLAMLAVGRTDVAGLVLYVLRPVATGTHGRTRYQVASLTFPEPDQALGGELGPAVWKADKDGVGIALTMRYDFLREGGNAETGEPQTRIVEQTLNARLQLASGELRAASP
ncbi:hypothetical protein [Tahibacter caeni]|uniref:hypothetical protein n=1 Tax=Tahibacter caeni TaxID=1453545 RepID=UPI002148C323|nr:hypothetical protein [Tahibacter caeni]